MALNLEKLLRFSIKNGAKHVPKETPDPYAPESTETQGAPVP